MLDIKITRTTCPKEKPQDESKLGFGKKFTDHMFVMDYTEGEGWHDARIVPYAPFQLDPATVVFHYAQEIFEGMKVADSRLGGFSASGSSAGYSANMMIRTALESGAADDSQICLLCRSGFECVLG